MEQQGKCVKARLLAIMPEGGYMVYVYQNLDNNEYVMCTRVPNWQGDEPKLLQDGFLSYKFVIAGRDEYYDKLEDKHKKYQYTATYFTNFVPITSVLKDGYVVDINTVQFA